MSGRGLRRHRCRHYGRPRAYSPHSWRNLHSGRSPYEGQPGWPHPIGRREDGGLGWRCPLCGDEWKLWIGLGGLLRLWWPAHAEASGRRRDWGSQPEWWTHGYRQEAEAASTHCAHPRIKEIRETGQRGTARQRNVLLSRCRRCGRVVDWKRVEG